MHRFLETLKRAVSRESPAFTRPGDDDQWSRWIEEKRVGKKQQEPNEPRRRGFRVVRGGTNETLTCACTVEIPGFNSRAVTCQCTETKYFSGNVPQKWTCPDCVKGKHKLF